MFIHDCISVYDSNTIIKFADDTLVVGLIRGDNETAYRDEVPHLSTRCANNNLELNTRSSWKTRKTVMDFRQAQSHVSTPILHL